MISYGRQFIGVDDIQSVTETLQGAYLTGGPAVESFEKALADYCGAKHAVAVSNGTAALHLAMLAARIGPGMRVLTSANTFLASANCAAYVGAIPDFADIELQTYNMSAATLKSAWREDVKAVVAVDFAGQPCDMPSIAALARERGAVVIEDAAHAIGSRFVYQGKEYKVGGHPWADMTTLSFHPVKTITTGEGGAIVTDNDSYAARCRMLRSHGVVRQPEQEPWYYEMQELGYNYRITDIQCALGVSQLKKLEGFRERRSRIVEAYNEAFRGIKSLSIPYCAVSNKPCWHLYVIQFDFKALGLSRSEVMGSLSNQGVGSQVHYIPTHLQPFYQNQYGYRAGKCPQAEMYYQQCLSLPLYPAMTDDNVQKVIKAVRNIKGEDS
jgi:perosamine synthetase